MYEIFRGEALLRLYSKSLTPSSRLLDVMDLKTDNLKAHLSTIGDKVFSTSHQLQQKLYTGPRSKDPVVEDLKARFEVVHNCANTLLKGCHTYENSIRDLSKHFYHTIEVFKRIYEIDGCEKQSKRDFENLAKRFEIIKNKIYGDLPIFTQNVIHPIEKFHATCVKVQSTIDKRDFASYKADSLKHKLCGFTPQKLSTPGIKYENEKMKIESRYEKAFKEYEPLNDQLRSELAVFLPMANTFFRNWFLNHYYITYSFYYNMYTFIGSCSEVRKIIFHPSNKDEPYQDSLSPSSVQIFEYIDSANHNLLAQFHFDFDNVSEQLKALDIVHFDTFYTKASASAKNAYSKHHDNSADTGSSDTGYQCYSPQYCKVIADFVRANEDSENTLSLHKEDIIKIYRKETDVWWYGQSLRTNKIGYFPVQCTTMEKS